MLSTDHTIGDALGESDRTPKQIGAYAILREIGRGGQGIVFLAQDTRLHRLVALKILTGLGAVSPAVLQRFQREAIAASKLDHPGICTVYDTGTADGVPYIAMRYVEGSTLLRLVRDLGATGEGVSTAYEPGLAAKDDDARTELMPPSGDPSTAAAPPRPEGRPSSGDRIRRITRIIERAARALHAAHEHGIIHRDVKPGNIMITANDEPVILDFGLARDCDSEIDALTQTGDVFGTPAYMSPEQMQGQTGSVDGRTDVWSLGVTLYECLTGVRPFEGATREMLFQSVTRSDPPDIRKRCMSASADLSVVLQAALEKEPIRRYQTAAAFANDLAAVLENRPISVRPVSTIGRLMRWVRREPVKAALAGTLLVAVPALASLVTYSIATRADIQLAEESRRREAVETALVEGYFHIQEGNAADAAPAFEHALALDPQNVEALAGALMTARVSRGDNAFLAEVERRNWARLGESALDPLIADALVVQGRREEAVALVKRSRPGESPIAHFIRGVMELTQGHAGDDSAFARARDDHLRAVIGSPRARAMFHFGLAHAAGHVREADLSRWVAASIRNMWPDDGYAAYWVGFALAPVDPDAALAAYAEALARAPKLASARFAVAMVHEEQGKHASAAAELQSLLAEGLDDARIHDALSEIHRVQHDLVQAEQHQREAVRLAPFRSIYQSRLVTLLQLAGKNDEWPALAEKAITVDPKNGTAWTQAGIARQLNRDLAGALAAQRRAAELRPNDARVLVNLAQAEVASGDQDSAVVTLDRALAIDPNLLEARYNRAAILRDSGREDEAVEDYRAVVAANPGAGDALCNLGHTLREMGRYLEALDAMRRGHEVGSRTPGWKYRSDAWVANLEALAPVETRFDAVAGGAAEPQDFAESLRLSRVAFGRKRFVMAVRLFEKAMELNGGVAPHPRAADRLHAARAAAAAAARMGADWMTIDAESRTALRTKAIGWVRDDLEAWDGMADDLGSRDVRAAQICVAQILNCSEFAGIRPASPDSRATAPSSRAASAPADVAGLWARVRQFRERLRLRG